MKHCHYFQDEFGRILVTHRDLTSCINPENLETFHTSGENYVLSSAVGIHEISISQVEFIGEPEQGLRVREEYMLIKIDP